MPSTIQELAGLSKALDRFVDRIKAYRKVLFEWSLGRSPHEDPMAEIAITKGEVDTIEELIRGLARRITGSGPPEAVWESLHSYCSRNQDKKEGLANQDYEYFRWALMWVQKTRTYLEYLLGQQSAEGEPRDHAPEMADFPPGIDVPRFDVALSFAGEDRTHAKHLADLLRRAGFSVFYDEYEKATLWGRNLYTHLSNVYQNKARYCLMFISANYARKLWTKREREAAQARAFRESREYILPLRLDDTELPGIEDTVGYIDLRTTSHEEVMILLNEKLKS